MHQGKQLSQKPIASRFCWYPSPKAETLEVAIENEASRVGLPDTQSILVLENALIAVRLMELGKLRYSRDYKRLAVVSIPRLFEIRITVPADLMPNQLRIYFSLPSHFEFAVGLLARFKRLNGTREQIRIWQNQDISDAVGLLNEAKRENFRKCVARSIDCV